jgi:hypothetical protein
VEFRTVPSHFFVQTTPIDTPVSAIVDATHESKADRNRVFAGATQMLFIHQPNPIIPKFRSM